MIVKITVTEKRIKVRSPFHPRFPVEAKHLGGRWDGDARIWTFDPRDEDSVRDLCRDLFGTDGESEPELVDCRVRLSGRQDDAVWLCGREIARRRGRDAPVCLGDGVVLVEGEFARSGGSRRYPRVSFVGDNVLLEVRDVPLALARREAESEDVEILSDLSNTAQPEIVAIKLPAPLVTQVEKRHGGDTSDAIIAALEAYLAD